MAEQECGWLCRFLCGHSPFRDCLVIGGLGLMRLLLACSWEPPQELRAQSPEGLGQGAFLLLSALS